MDAILPCTRTTENRFVDDMTLYDDETYATRDSLASRGSCTYASEPSEMDFNNTRATFGNLDRFYDTNLIHKLNAPSTRGKPLIMSKSDEEISALMGVTDYGTVDESVTSPAYIERKIAPKNSYDLNLNMPTQGALANHSLHQYPPTRSQNNYPPSDEAINMNRLTLDDRLEQDRQKNGYDPGPEERDQRSASRSVYQDTRVGSSSSTTSSRNTPSCAGSRGSRDETSSDRSRRVGGTPHGHLPPTPPSSGSVQSRNNPPSTGSNHSNHSRDQRGQPPPPLSPMCASANSRNNPFMAGNPYRVRDDNHSLQSRDHRGPPPTPPFSPMCGSVDSRTNLSTAGNMYRYGDDFNENLDPRRQQRPPIPFSPCSGSVTSRSTLSGSKYGSENQHNVRKNLPPPSPSSFSNRTSSSTVRYLDSINKQGNNNDLSLCSSTSSVGSRVRVATAYGTIDSDLEQINVPPGDMGLKLRSTEQGLVITRKTYNSVCPELSVGDIIVALDGVDVSIEKLNNVNFLSIKTKLFSLMKIVSFFLQQVSSFPPKTVKKLLDARQSKKNRAIIFKPGFLSEQSQLQGSTDSRVWVNPNFQNNGTVDKQPFSPRRPVESNAQTLSPSSTCSQRSDGTFVIRQQMIPQSTLNSIMSHSKQGLRKAIKK